MSTSLAKVSTGALTLLVIALEKDRDKLMFGNAAFRRALEAVGRLPAFCARNPSSLIEDPVAPHPPPRDMFLACCQLVDHLSRELQRQPNRAGEWKGSSEFDHPALLALGQTISAATGTRNGVHVDFSTGVKKLAVAVPRDLQRSFATHYVGNLLQDYFDAAEIWRSVPDLPENTAGLLRSHDAAILTDTAFANFSAVEFWSPDQVVGALQRMSAAAFLEQKGRA